MIRARPPRARRRAVGPAGAADAGGAPGRVRRLLRAHRRARRAVRAAAAAPRRCMDSIAFGAARRRPRRRPRRVRAMHTPRARRADASPPGASRPARRTPPTTRCCCCGSSRALADSALVVYQRYVRPLSPRRARRLLAGLQGRSGASSGCATRTCRTTIEDFDALHDARWSRATTCTSPTRRASSRSQIVMRPPVPLARAAAARGRRTRHGRAAAAAACAASTASRGTPARALVLRGGAEYAKRVLVPLLPDRWRYRRRRRPAQAGLTRPGPGRPVPPAPVADGLPRQALRCRLADLRPAASERGSGRSPPRRISWRRR